jgi:hypothetical protein
MDRRTLYCDVDDTLLCHDLSSFPKELQVEIYCNDRYFVGVPHQKNINLLVKFYKLGYDVYVWSKTGESWARAVVEKLELTPYVKACLSKPDFILDDRGVEDWIGTRIYRSPDGSEKAF